MKSIQEFEPEVLQQFTENPGVSIPGQSLTNDPDNPYPWEQSPKYTKHQEALDYIVSELLEEDRLYTVMDSVSKGVPVSDIAYMVLRKGFSNGLFNPDLMLILAEPLMYVIIALAEKSGVEYVLYEGEHLEEDEFEMDDTEDEDLPDIIKQKLRKPSGLAQSMQETITRESLEKVELPESVEEKIEEFEPSESLLARQEPEQKGLLERS